jgi:hypothetical protein
MAPPRSFVALRREILGGVEVPKLILSIVRSYEDYRPVWLVNRVKSNADVVGRIRVFTKYRTVRAICWMPIACMMMPTRFGWLCFLLRGCGEIC